jgi:DNA-binding protein HU-beta
MNRSDLVDSAARRAGLGKSEVSKALDALIDTITDSVQKGEKVSLTGFGTFELRDRAARTGRNPQTGAPMEVAASRAPAFKPGKSFKDAVNR